MALIYQHDNQGGFTVGDTSTGVTAYAYPTSPHATKAKKAAGVVASVMAANANKFDLTFCMTAHNARLFHQRLWERLMATPL